MPDVKPIPGGKTEVDIDQSFMVVPAPAEEPGEASEGDAKGGGRIYTKEHEETETRPQELHGSVNYQKETAQPGKAPSFIAYTELTEARGKVRG